MNYAMHLSFVKIEIRVELTSFLDFNIQGEADKVLQSDSTQALLIISKNVSVKSFSVQEGRHTGPPYFLSVKALRLRQGQLHFLKWNYVFFFYEIITDFETNSATYNTRSF